MMKRDMAAMALATPGVRRLVAAALPRDGVLVLNYHRVGESERSPYDRALWSASADGFDAQVAFLKSHCDVIALDDIDAAMRSRGRHVAITFDDGYRDNHDIAFPVLRRHGVPAAFFIATGFIDHRTLPWWDAIALQVRGSRQHTLDLSPWLPAPLVLESNIDYVRRVLRSTVHLTAKREEYVDVCEMKNGTFHDYQNQVNIPMENVMSHEVIGEYIRRNGQDYRFEVAEHPIPELRCRTEDNTQVGRLPEKVVQRV